MGAGAGSRGRGDQGAARVTLRRWLWTGDRKGKGLGKAPRETRTRFQREGVTAGASLMEGWAQQAGRRGQGWWEGFGGALGANPPVQEGTIVEEADRVLPGSFAVEREVGPSRSRGRGH